jgi:penicillin-binding protein 1C
MRAIWKRIGKKKWLFPFPVCFIAWFYFSLPQPLFKDPYSTVLESSTNELLSASIAKDGQWRFPALREVPQKFEVALLTFEDKRFYYHPGVDVLSLAGALTQNVSAGRIVRGASTVSMQVIRLSRKGKPRTVPEKLYEMVLAFRLELRYSKEEILQLYASHAPFGGNVVGLEAACWRYFGRNEKELSWGEAAFLAVLPNAPGLVHPGRNRGLLRAKRDALLDQLMVEGHIDEFTCSLAKTENIPEEPHRLPRLARHLLTRASREGGDEKRIRSSISRPEQERLEEILLRHQTRLDGNEIHNGAAIIADVRSGEVLAYAGNVNASPSEGADVDIITSPRSPGSILKPVLFAASLDEGKILPRSLLPDVPAFISGFTPKNFSNDYDGAVNADKALIRSLNIPAVFMLKDFRYERFHSLLRNAGLTTLNKPADHYGLSLILGGAEATLWDVAGLYASMARTLSNYFEYPGANRYSKRDFHSLTYRQSSLNDSRFPAERSSWLSASSIYQTFEVLQELYRPGEESGWKHFESSRRIAWKTGTSFGFRDAWAVGVTPDYVVAVWIGNADGEGRPGLTGIEAAAPVMFDIFSGLQGHAWFKRPEMEMVRGTVCRASGLRNSVHCPIVDTLWLCERGLGAEVCLFHRTLHLSQDEKFQLNTRCANLAEIHHRPWFVLPPVQEHYFRSKNISYKSPPPFRKDCASSAQSASMDLVYPKPNSKLFIPRDGTGKAGSAVFQLAHQNAGTTVYWYLDGNYLGSTRKTHQLPLSPASGKHRLTVFDESGESLDETFEVLSDL